MKLLVAYQRRQSWILMSIGNKQSMYCDAQIAEICNVTYKPVSKVIYFKIFL